MAAVTLYPNTFLRLILLGWLLMALPLLAAIGFVSVSLNSISVKSEAAVRQASQTARLGWELPEQLTHMERSLRQYEVLRDRSLLDDYAVVQREWRQASTDFAAIPLLSPLAEEVMDMLDTESAVYTTAEVTPNGIRTLRDVVTNLKARTFTLLDHAGQRIDTEREAFRLETDRLRERLLLSLTLAFALAALLFWFARRILSRLLSRFERAVIALGQNKLDRSIRLKGPEDLQWVGRRLDWLRKRLLALEEQRTRILRHMSHELKTPLAALREGASLLNEGVAGPLSPQQARIAGIMQGNSLRLQTLIDGLLKMQQAGHIRDRIEPVAVQLDTLIQQILATHQLGTRNKCLHISGSLAPLAVEGGREELTTVLDNLIANAIKFSPDDSTVRVNLTRQSEAAVIDIIDHGPGVPEADREKIFEPFFRSASTKSVAGVGLGLAIARELVMAHRGTLELIPTPEGTHFRVSLPMTQGGA